MTTADSFLQGPTFQATPSDCESDQAFRRTKCMVHLAAHTYTSLAVCLVHRLNAELAKAEVAELKKLEQQLQQALHSEAEWWIKPSASFVGAALIGVPAGHQTD